MWMHPLFPKSMLSVPPGRGFLHTIQCYVGSTHRPLWEQFSYCIHSKQTLSAPSSGVAVRVRVRACSYWRIQSGETTSAWSHRARRETRRTFQTARQGTRHPFIEELLALPVSEGLAVDRWALDWLNCWGRTFVDQWPWVFRLPAVKVVCLSPQPSFRYPWARWPPLCTIEWPVNVDVGCTSQTTTFV